MTLSYMTASYEKTEYLVNLILRKEAYFKIVY